MALRGLCRRPGRRGCHRGGHGRHLGRTNVADAAVAVVSPIGVDHERLPRRLAGRHRASRRPASSSRARSASSPSSRSRRPRSYCVERPRSAARLPARAASSASPTGCRAWAARWSRSKDSERRTTKSSCRSTARTRHTTRPALWRPSRRSPGARASRAASTSRSVREAFATGHIAGAARDRPPFADRRARRGAQPARRPGDGQKPCRSPSPSARSIGVVGVMADKDVDGLLDAFEPVMCDDRLHPELHAPGDARGGRSPRSLAGFRRRPRRGGAPSRRRHRGGDRVRRERRRDGFALGAGGCWSRARSSPPGRRATLLGGGVS